MTNDEPRLERVADGVWAYVQPDGGWMVNNMGVIAGDVVTSVDLTSTERRTRAYLAAVAGATGREPRRVVFTHSHPDHCNGASLVPEAEIIAHRSVADDLQRPHRLAPHIFEPFEQGDTPRARADARVRRRCDARPRGAADRGAAPGHPGTHAR